MEANGSVFLDAVLSSTDLLIRALTSNSPLGWVIVALISFIGVLTVIYLLGVQRYSRFERENLAVARRRIADLGGVTSPIPDEDVVKEISSLPDGATRTVLSVLRSMRRLPSPSVSTAIGVTSQQELDRLARFRPIPNSLMMLGLFGTVVGLSGVIGTLGPQVSAALSMENSLLLSEALGQTLSEMQTAFSCTMYGVLFSVVVAATLARTTRRLAELLEDIELAAVHVFAPALLPMSQEYQVAELREVLQYSQQFLTSFRDSIRESSESFTAVLIAAGETTRTSIQGLSDTTTTMSTLLSQISAAVLQSSEALQTTNATTAREASALTDATASLGERLDRFEDTLVQERQAVGIERKANIDRFSEVSSSLVSQLEAMQHAFTTTLDKNHALTEDSHQAINSAIRENSLLFSGVEQAMKDFRQVLISNDDSLAANLSAIRRYQEALVRAVEVLSNGGQSILESDLHESGSSGSAVSEVPGSVQRASDKAGGEAPRLTFNEIDGRDNEW